MHVYIAPGDAFVTGGIVALWCALNLSFYLGREPDEDTQQVIVVGGAALAMIILLYCILVDATHWTPFILMAALGLTSGHLVSREPLRNFLDDLERQERQRQE